MRVIDADRFGEIMEQWKKDCLADNDTQGADIISDVILQLDDMPTITPPNEPLTQDSRLTPKMVTCPKGWQGVRDTRFYCPDCKKAAKKGEAYCHKCGQALIFPVQRYDKENNEIWLDFSDRRPPEGEGKLEHILSLSYGKDSLACLGAIERMGWPLDRIVHAEVWATDTIPADLPPMVEFKDKADGIIKERWGIEVEHVRAKRCYQDVFYMVCHGEKSYISGKIYGWPFQRGPWCNSRLKQHVLSSTLKNAIQYIGIAADEPNRFHHLTETKKSPLVEAGWTEDDCRRWCEENDLLSPIYTTATRGGCWFCHNQGVGQLRLLRKNYPELWALMLKWDKDSPVTFHADGHTVHDFDRRFQMEDEGLIYPYDKVFRWSMLEEELNYRWF